MRIGSAIVRAVLSAAIRVAEARATVEREIGGAPLPLQARAGIDWRWDIRHEGLALRLAWRRRDLAVRPGEGIVATSIKICCCSRQKDNTPVVIHFALRLSADRDPANRIGSLFSSCSRYNATLMLRKSFWSAQGESTCMRIWTGVGLKTPHSRCSVKAATRVNIWPQPLVRNGTTANGHVSDSVAFECFRTAGINAITDRAIAGSRGL